MIFMIVLLSMFKAHVSQLRYATADQMQSSGISEGFY